VKKECEEFHKWIPDDLLDGKKYKNVLKFVSL
jgi:hypothetical protein